MAWWVHYEETYGVNSAWHGPFDSDEAARFARVLSKSHNAEQKFAEVIAGERGEKGRRIAEFSNGEEYTPGGSGWHEFPYSEEIDIPANAGRVT